MKPSDCAVSLKDSMEKPVIGKKEEKTSPTQIQREHSRFVPANDLIASFIFLILTILAAGDLLKVLPYFSALVAQPFFPFFHETHDLLALTVVLYAAHKLSPAIGYRALLWFSILHIPYIYMVFPRELPELVRLGAMIVVGALGVHIIVVRGRLEVQLNQLASELETQRRVERRRADEMSILNRIAMVGIDATNVDPLLENAVQIIDDILHPDFFGVGLVDEALGVMQIYRSTPFIQGERLTFPLGRGVAGQVIETGEPRRIPDVSREPVYRPVNPGTRSELCVPLKVGKRTIGMINIESVQFDFFSEDDERLIMTFAGQLATSIERVRLFQAEQRQRREAETLREAGAVVAATLRQDKAIELILQQLARVVPYDSAAVMLWHEEPPRSGAGYLEIVGGQGWANPSVVIGMRFPIPGDNPNTIVIQKREPYILVNAPDSYAAFHQEPHSHIHSWLGVPLIVGDRLIGMLSVDHTRQAYYTTDQARLVTAFANQVAIAIENTRLFGRVEQLAITDGLTGLYNRRHFLELAEHEFQRARRYRRPLAAIMFDIDHFKHVNDTYSHAVGDQVLQALATHCRDSLREIDFIGRYGGEEFAVLLPETDILAAKAVAERLRRCMAENPVHTDQGPITVTISLGVATITDDCPDLAKLLDRTDVALYAAKSSGRNRIMQFQ